MQLTSIKSVYSVATDHPKNSKFVWLSVFDFSDDIKSKKLQYNIVISLYQIYICTLYNVCVCIALCIV